MTINNDLSTPLLEVRLIIGDSSGELISDETITALLNINNNNVGKTSIQALTAIVADLAKYVNEEVGETKAWWDQQYQHYKDLLDKITKDPAFAIAPALHYFGGVSVSEVDRVNNNPDSRGAGIRQGEFTSNSSSCYDPENPFFLDNC